MTKQFTGTAVMLALTGFWGTLTMAQAQDKSPAGVPAPAPAPKVAAVAAAYPPLAPSAHPDTLGRGIQRTMGLLANSTLAKQNKVRILFYGQSITEQDWSKQVADDLRRRFAYADIDIRNRAIGGFASQMLIRPAEHDVYPFYPDLIIFHVYGANQQYEEIIRSIRSRTTAEVLMQRDHVTRIVPKEERTPEKDKGAWWDDFMNEQFLPQTAQKYGCGLVDVRGEWLRYLAANHLEPKALLSDDVHLNAHGNFVMAEAVKQYLVYRPELAETVDKGAIKTLTVGKELKLEKGVLRLPFNGNRVDLILGAGSVAKPSSAQILVDGKKPSDFAEMFQITRPEPGPWSPLFLSRVDRGTMPLQAETWSLKITDVGADSKTWGYTLTGSKTGPDGVGKSDAPFTSLSGRVRIAPESFFHPDGKIIPVGYEIKWYALPGFRDTVIPALAPVAGTNVEAAVTILQGLPSGPHTLELTASGDFPLRAIRVYKPPVPPATSSQP